MNKAKTLKRHNGNPNLFLGVAQDTDDKPSQVSINPNLKGRYIDWRRALKNVFKLQKLIYRASNYGEIRKMRKYQKLLTKSYYPGLLAVRLVTQVDPGKKTTGLDGIKSLPPMQRFNQVELLNTGYIKASPNDGNWTSWSSGIGKHPGVRKEVTIE